MQACVQQELSGSSFVGAYLSVIPAHFDSILLTVMDTQILRWRDFDAYVPACLPFIVPAHDMVNTGLGFYVMI
jgi:hypothetical protein